MTNLRGQIWNLFGKAYRQGSQTGETKGFMDDDVKTVFELFKKAGYVQLKELPLLSGQDWEKVNRKCGVDIIDIVTNLDNRYTKVQQAELIAERCEKTAQTQLDLINKLRGE